MLSFNPGPREKSGDILLKSPAIPSKSDHSDETAEDELDLPLYDLNTIVIATNNFSDVNKLGKGGFGSVYKVNLYSKRLS